MTSKSCDVGSQGTNLHYCCERISFVTGAINSASGIQAWCGIIHTRIISYIDLGEPILIAYDIAKVLLIRRQV